jgi:hypothetical protein
VSFTTTIKRKWWDMKMGDSRESGVFVEYKEDRPFWNTRIGNLRAPCEGVFLVGREVHRVRVVAIYAIRREDVPEVYREAMTTPFGWALRCEVPA